jgi:hypothetical protein
VDPDPAIFASGPQNGNKKTIIFSKVFFSYYFMMVHLHHFQKDKKSKRSHHKALGIKVFLTIFAWG